MDLAAYNFQDSPLLARLPRFDSIIYKGELRPKTPFFQAVRGREEVIVITSTIIRAEESLLWESCRDLLDHSLKRAAAGLQGIYGFELLSIELERGIQHFDWNDLSQLIVNHARKLSPGEKRLIQYGSIFGLLSKRVNESWGKVDWKAHVQVYRGEPGRFDLFLRKLLKEAAQFSDPVIILVLDLSGDPVLQPGVSPEEMEKLRKVLAGAAEGEERVPPDVNVIHRSGVIDLGELVR